MIRPNPILNVYVAEKAAANLVVTTHRHPHPRPQRITARQISNHFFNSLLDGGAQMVALIVGLVVIAWIMFGPLSVSFGGIWHSPLYWLCHTEDYSRQQPNPIQCNQYGRHGPGTLWPVAVTLIANRL